MNVGIRFPYSLSSQILLAAFFIGIGASHAFAQDQKPPALSGASAPAASMSFDIENVVRPGEVVNPGDIVSVQRNFYKWSLTCLDFLGVRHTCHVGTTQRSPDNTPVSIEFNKTSRGVGVTFIQIPRPIDETASIKLDLDTVSFNIGSPRCTQQICVFMVPTKTLASSLSSGLKITWMSPAPSPHPVAMSIDLNGLIMAMKSEPLMTSAFPGRRSPLLEAPSNGPVGSDQGKKP